MSELDIILLVLPILIPVGVGWLIVRTKMLGSKDADVLSAVFLRVAAPALIIMHLAKRDIEELIEPQLILATLFLMLGLYLAVYLVHRALGRDMAASAFAAFVGSKFNAVVVGLPVLMAMVDHHAIVTMTINVVAGYFTILPLTLILSDIGKSGAASGAAVFKVLRHALFRALTHPLVAATILGLLLAGFRVDLPGWVDKTLLTLGSAAIPLALLAVGMSLSAHDMRENAGEIAWMSVVRVIISPALAIGVALLFGLEGVFAVALVVSFSLPTAKMVLPLAEEAGVYVKPAAGVIAVTTASVLVVWPLVIWVCHHLWPGVIGTGG